jgi:hypothetical protein
MNSVHSELLNFVGSRRFSTLLVDPPWQFANRTGKIAPEHQRLSRYGTLTDLWADIEVCLSEIDDFESRNSLAQQTFYRIGNELGRALAGLASCERVAIWGIAN